MSGRAAVKDFIFSKSLPLATALIIIAACAFALEVAAENAGSSGSTAESPGTLDVAAVLAGAESVFVSDYFSFIGADEKGHVAFAIDNNRSRRGRKFSADAHVVLHDEHEGWLSVSGAGDYENKKKELLAIPDSPDFQFTGEVKSGITLHSPNSRLELEVAPIDELVSRAGDKAIFSMASASATLKWRGRVIPGRIIYEYIFMKNLSRWYAAFSGLYFNDFQGLYLKTGDGGDFYLHTSKGTAWQDMFDRVMGFQVIDGQYEMLRELRIEVPERSLGPGFYRWPQSWRVSWQGSKGSGTLSVNVIDRKTVTNWIIGGFAMAIVTGELTYGGKTRHVYGLAELIR